MLEANPTGWESLVPSMQFSYNSAVTRATKMSPFYSLYGLNPRTVLNSAHFEARPYYSENYQTELVQRLQAARKLAIENNWKYKVDFKNYYRKSSLPADV